MKLLYIRVIYGEPEKLPYGISVLNLENSHPPVNIHFLKKKKKIKKRKIKKKYHNFEMKKGKIKKIIKKINFYSGNLM